MVSPRSDCPRSLTPRSAAIALLLPPRPLKCVTMLLFSFGTRFCFQRIHELRLALTSFVPPPPPVRLGGQRLVSLCVSGTPSRIGCGQPGFDMDILLRMSVRPQLLPSPPRRHNCTSAPGGDPGGNI